MSDNNKEKLLNFGPEWLQNNLSSKESALASSSTSINSSNNNKLRLVSKQKTPVLRYKRQELLSFFDAKLSPPKELKSNKFIYVKKAKLPLAFHFFPRRRFKFSGQVARRLGQNDPFSGPDYRPVNRSNTGYRDMLRPVNNFQPKWCNSEGNWREHKNEVEENWRTEKSNVPRTKWNEPREYRRTDMPMYSSPCEERNSPEDNLPEWANSEYPVDEMGSFDSTGAFMSVASSVVEDSQLTESSFESFSISNEKTEGFINEGMPHQPTEEEQSHTAAIEKLANKLHSLQLEPNYNIEEYLNKLVDSDAPQSQTNIFDPPQTFEMAMNQQLDMMIYGLPNMSQNPMETMQLMPKLNAPTQSIMTNSVNRPIPTTGMITPNDYMMYNTSVQPMMAPMSSSDNNQTPLNYQPYNSIAQPMSSSEKQLNYSSYDANVQQIMVPLSLSENKLISQNFQPYNTNVQSMSSSEKQLNFPSYDTNALPMSSSNNSNQMIPSNYQPYNIVNMQPVVPLIVTTDQLNGNSLPNAVFTLCNINIPTTSIINPLAFTNVQQPLQTVTTTINASAKPILSTGVNQLDFTAYTSDGQVRMSPPNKLPENTWFYVEKIQTKSIIRGPVVTVKMLQFLKTGIINDDTLVRKGSGSQFVPLIVLFEACGRINPFTLPENFTARMFSDESRSFEYIEALRRQQLQSNENLTKENLVVPLEQPFHVQNEQISNLNMANTLNPPNNYRHMMKPPPIMELPIQHGPTEERQLQLNNFQPTSMVNTNRNITDNWSDDIYAAYKANSNYVPIPMPDTVQQAEHYQPQGIAPIVHPQLPTPIAVNRPTIWDAEHQSRPIADDFNFRPPPSQHGLQQSVFAQSHQTPPQNPLHFPMLNMSNNKVPTVEKIPPMNEFIEKKRDEERAQPQIDYILKYQENKYGVNVPSADKSQRQHQEMLNQQQQQQQRKTIHPSVNAPYPWKLQETSNQIEGLRPLTEIQRFEKQQQMVNQISSAKKQIVQPQMESAPKFTWSVPVTKPVEKSLSQIQAEEQSRIMKEKYLQPVQFATPISTMNQTAIWNNNPPKVKRPVVNSPEGFWDMKLSKLKYIKKQQQSLNDDINLSTVNAPKTDKGAIPKVKKDKENNEKTEDDEAINKFNCWAMNELKSMSEKIDVVDFVDFLRITESPYEVEEYTKFYLGDTKYAYDFAKLFILRRSQMLFAKAPLPSDDLCSPAPAFNPTLDRREDYKNKGKKKKGKMSKVDSRILGFNATASENRFNIGNIESST